MGIKPKEVRLEPHNPHWHLMFSKELDQLWDYFGDTAIRISHIGSTAIDGLEAKPIIDIVVAVNDLDDFNAISHKFTSDPNYSIKKDFSNEEILIRKGDKQNRLFYIHVMDIDSRRYKDAIMFRDLLLHDKKIHKDYRNLKHVLGEKYSHNRRKYSTTKADFTQNALKMVQTKNALIPTAIIGLIALFVAAISLWARLSMLVNIRIFGIRIISIESLGLGIGGAVAFSEIVIAIVLLVNYFRSRKKYRAIMTGINKTLSKE